MTEEIIEAVLSNFNETVEYDDISLNRYLIIQTNLQTIKVLIKDSTTQDTSLYFMDDDDSATHLTDRNAVSWLKGKYIENIEIITDGTDILVGDYKSGYEIVLKVQLVNRTRILAFIGRYDTSSRLVTITKDNEDIRVYI